MMAGYAACLLLLAAACYLLPGLRAVAWGLLGLTGVAEGIESEVQRDLLVSMGCQFGQVYLLSGPLDAAQAAEMTAPGRSLLPRLTA